LATLAAGRPAPSRSGRETAHVHHQRVLEANGIVAAGIATIAPRGSWMGVQRSTGGTPISHPVVVITS
jgi:hypothetical protein